MDTTNTLLLTLNIDSQAQQYFNILRQRYFPADRNFLDAHLMLFHQLPADEPSIITDIEIIASKHLSMVLNVPALSSIGNGVAFKIICAELQQLHRQLQTQWQQWLIPQDRNKLWPHITIQNKVTPATARQTITELSADFKPFDITGTGLSLWEYKGGPWKFISEWAFNVK